MLLSSAPYLLATYVMITRGTIGIIIVLAAQAAINYVLKQAIRQRRPPNAPKTCGWSPFGMPSTHAQLVVLLVLMFFSRSSAAWGLAILVMAQRVWSDCHTIPQVLAGAATGATISMVLR